jgi:hypothetical protein
MSTHIFGASGAAGLVRFALVGEKTEGRKAEGGKRKQDEPCRMGIEDEDEHEHEDEVRSLGHRNSRGSGVQRLRRG